MDLPPPVDDAVAEPIAAVEAPAPGDALEASLRRFVEARCDVVRVEVRHVGTTVPVDAVDSLVWTGDPCRPQPVLTLRLGATRRTLHPVLDLFVEGPVAPYDVQPGEVFHVERGPVPWRAAQVNPLVGRVRSRVALSEGDPVTPVVASRVPDATHGQAVSLILQRGVVTVAAPGVLLGPAFVGERVAVRNEATRVVQHGVLVAPDTVSLTP